MKKSTSKSRKKVVGTPKLRLTVPSPILFCPGCHHPLIGRIVAEIVEEFDVEGDTILLSGIGCNAVISGYLNLDVFLPAGAHGRAPDVGTGVRRILGDSVVLLAILGDGDAMAIGTEPLIQAAARSERLTVIMANNQVYGTTGGQLAPTTAMNHVTPTTPDGRKPIHGYPIDTAELMASIDGVVYSARGALNSFSNYQKTKKYVKKAIRSQMNDEGFSFVEIMGACPTGWHMRPVDCIRYMEEKLIPEFPLGEYKDASIKEDLSAEKA